MAVEVRLTESPFGLKETQSLIERPSPPDSVVTDFVNKPEIAAKVHPKWAFFNRAKFLWEQDNSTYFFERAVHRDYLRRNFPDRSVIVVTKQDENGNVIRLPDLDLAVDGVFNWEDPRVEANGKSVRLGLTAVKTEANGSYPLHPAIVDLSVNGSLEVTRIQIFDYVQGKNVVPMDGGFIYRREGETHVLDKVRPTLGDSLIVENHIDFSQFSDVSWIKKKIGAVARPIDLFGDFRILPVHGVRSGSREGERGVDDVYAIGMAVIDKNWRVIAVDPKPLFERDHFLDILPISEELNPKKRVVYCCDFIEKVDEIIFLLTVGDRITKPEITPRKSLEARALKILASAN